MSKYLNGIIEEKDNQKDREIIINTFNSFVDEGAQIPGKLGALTKGKAQLA